MSLPEVKATYTARAIGCYFGRAGEHGDGNVQVFVPFRITFEDGDEHITWAGTLADGKAFEIAIQALRALGWMGDDLSELDDLDEEGAARLLPNQVELACDMEEYQGERRLKVKWVNAPGGGRMTKHALGGADLKTFAAQMRGAIRGAAGAQRPAQRPQTRPAQRAESGRHPNAPGNGMDDIPF